MPHKGQIFMKASCLDCQALVPKENPQIRDRFKCALGIEIYWTELDNGMEFYAPTTHCVKPRTPPELKRAKEKQRNNAL